MNQSHISFIKGVSTILWFNWLSCNPLSLKTLYPSITPSFTLSHPLCIAIGTEAPYISFSTSSFPLLFCFNLFICLTELTSLFPIFKSIVLQMENLTPLPFLVRYLSGIDLLPPSLPYSPHPIPLSSLLYLSPTPFPALTLSLFRVSH